MRKLILILAVMGFTLQSYAQDVLSDTRASKEKVPMEITQAINIDFPDYQVEEFATAPIHYVGKDVFISGFDDPSFMSSYQVTLNSNGNKVIANYNEDGKLMSAIENLKNIAPPLEIRQSIAKNFPGWTISEDTYHMTKNENGNMTERYGFLLRKDGKKKHVYTDAKGNVLK